MSYQNTANHKIANIEYHKRALNDKKLVYSFIGDLLPVDYFTGETSQIARRWPFHEERKCLLWLVQAGVYQKEPGRTHEFIS